MADTELTVSEKEKATILISAIRGEITNPEDLEKNILESLSSLIVLTIFGLKTD